MSKQELKNKLQVLINSLGCEINELEKQRAWLNIKFLIVLGIAIFVETWLFLSLCKVLDVKINLINVTYFSFLAMCLNSIPYHLFNDFATKKYKANFKSQIIKPLIKLFDSSLEYASEKSIEFIDFRKSLLFERYYRFSFNDKFFGSDLIFGEMDSLNIKFSLLQALKNCGRGYATIFKGLFFIVDLPTNSINANFGTSKHISKIKIELDNPEFNKLYTVYSTDEKKSLQILSNKLTQKVIDILKNKKHKLDFSFIENKLYIAIHFKKLPFQIPVFKNLKNHAIYEEYLDDLTLAIDIVKIFNEAIIEQKAVS